ncbi:MAG: phosphotransferase, partial [Ilumatobacteraceae bacterium]
RPGRLVARHDSGTGPLSGTPFTLACEAATYAAVAGAGVPVPAVVAVAPDGRAFAVDEVPGTTDARGEAIDDYLRLLGTLHASGTAHVPSGHDGFDAAGTDDLAIWSRIAAERIARPAPIVARALRCLYEHGNDARRPAGVVLCHGDAGFGNYLHESGRVSGLVDWEMAHTGDPHDDLASVAVRAALTRSPLDHYRERIEANWEPASGLRFDERRYGVAVVAVLTRMVISCLAALDNPGAESDRTTQLMGLPVMEVLLVRAIAALDGVQLPSPSSASPDAAFVREMAELVIEGLPDAGAPGGAASRRRYLAAQLVDVLRSAETAPGPGAMASTPVELDVLWQRAHDRLAAVPASRRLADAPIAGLRVDGRTPC